MLAGAPATSPKARRAQPHGQRTGAIADRSATAGAAWVFWFMGCSPGAVGPTVPIVLSAPYRTPARLARRREFLPGVLGRGAILPIESVSAARAAAPRES